MNTIRNLNHKVADRFGFERMNLNTVTDFWSWWSRQIIELVPPVDPRTMANRRSKTEILLAKDGARLLRNQRLKQPLNGTALKTEAVDIESLAQKIRPREKVLLSIDESQCFVRDTLIPAAAAHRAGEILNLELSRVSPLRRQDVFSAWYPNGASEAGRLGFTHIVAKRDLVNSAVNALAHHKIGVVAVAFRKGVNTAAPVVLDGAGMSFGSRRESNWKRTSAGSGILFAISALALTWHWSSRLEDNLQMVEDSLQKIQAPAAANRKAIEDRQGLTAQLTELRKLRRKNGSLLESWEELSRVLPDTAWLQSLSQKGSSLLLEGSAEDAEGLIQSLEFSELFKSVKFVSPVIKNPGEEKVRFTISMEREGVSG